jgi:hypothetical protein
MHGRIRGYNYVDYKQLGPIRPAGVRNRQNLDYTEFFAMHLLNKCKGLNFLDEMDKSPDCTESGFDKF